MTCATSLAQDICPTQEQLIPQYLALLPRGRAWGEGGPAREPGGIIYGWLSALAAIFALVHAAICALIPEFFCSTAVETAAWWAEEYAVDDGCDPFPDACAKIAAQGGVTCAYYEEIAALHGWDIVCGVLAEVVAATTASASCIWASGAGSICPYPGTPARGPAGAGQLQITVLVPAPTTPAPAPTAIPIVPPLAGRMHAGGFLTCIPSLTSPSLSEPDITGLRCLLARVAPAHAKITFSFGVV
jgi:uncharacterized protein YmfQ (DUF2313 family)